jgi:transposase
VVEARQRYRETMGSVAAEQLVFLDESGVTTSMTRLYGRAPKGKRVREAVPQGRWQVMTMLGALGATGLQAAMTIEGATDGDVFATFVSEVLVPTLRAGQVVLLDNLSAHKDARVQAAIEACGCRLVFLPPYSPDLNPIEMAWSKVKTQLRTRMARAWDQLEQGVGAALRSVTPGDVRGYFRHCGYALQ